MPIWLDQLEIIKEIASKKCDEPGPFSLAKLDRLLGLSQGKSRKWANGQRPSADDLEMISRKLGISSRWLLLGEGEPQSDIERVGGADFSVETANGKLPGDYIWQATRELGLSEEGLASLLDISVNELQDYLASRRVIPWNVLTRLASNVGISLNCLLADIEPLLLHRTTIVDRMMMATGASLDELAWTFGVPLEQLKAVAAEEKEAEMPYKWVQQIALDYGLKPNWLRDGTPPILMSEGEREKYKDMVNKRVGKNVANGA